MFEIVQEIAFYTSNMCAQQVMCCTFINKKKKCNVLYKYRPKPVGPARLHIVYTLTFSYEVMKRILKTYRVFTRVVVISG